MSEYIGGSRLSMGEIQALVAEKLTPLVGRDLGHHWPCPCGGTVYVKHLRHFYCQKCGRRISQPDAQVPNSPRTFRQTFDAALFSDEEAAQS